MKSISNESLKQLAKDISDQYYAKQENPDFEPTTLEKYKKLKKDQDDERTKNYWDGVNKDKQIKNKQTEKLILKVAKHLGMSFEPTDTDYDSIFRIADKMLRNNNWDSFWKEYKARYDELAAIKDFEHDDLYGLALPENAGLLKIYKALFDKSDSWENFWFNAGRYLRSFED